MATELGRGLASLNWSNEIAKKWGQVFSDANDGEQGLKSLKQNWESSAATRAVSHCRSANSSPNSRSSDDASTKRSRSLSVDSCRNAEPVISISSTSSSDSHENRPVTEDNQPEVSFSQEQIVRKRGRPRKYPSKPQLIKSPDFPRRPVGRPKKSESEFTVKVKSEKVRTINMFDRSPLMKRPVGRPRKSESQFIFVQREQEKTEKEQGPEQDKRHVGRPRKSEPGDDQKKAKKRPHPSETANEPGNSSDDASSRLSVHDVFRELRESIVGEGIWIQCSNCSKWRHLPPGNDPARQPIDWTCAMNKDDKFNDCSAEQQAMEDTPEDTIDSQFSIGSIVWARTPGFPWWPAMVDFDPDSLEFYWIAEDTGKLTHFNVTYFDEKVSRAWVTCNNIRPFETEEIVELSSKHQNYAKPREQAVFDAQIALTLSIEDRACKFGFVAQLFKNGHNPAALAKLGASAILKNTMAPSKTSSVTSEVPSSVEKPAKKVKKDKSSSPSLKKDSKEEFESSPMKVVLPPKQISLSDWLMTGPQPPTVLVVHSPAKAVTVDC